MFKVASVSENMSGIGKIKTNKAFLLGSYVVKINTSDSLFLITKRTEGMND